MGDRNKTKLTPKQLEALDSAFVDELGRLVCPRGVKSFGFTGHVQSGAPDLAHVILGRVKVPGIAKDVPTVTILEDQHKWDEYVRISAEATAASILDDLGLW